MLYAWPHYWRLMSIQLASYTGPARTVPAYGHYREGYLREGPEAYSGLFGVFVPDWTPAETRVVLGVLAWRRLLRMGWKAWVDDWMSEEIPF